jgi:hypothetical protein
MLAVTVLPMKGSGAARSIHRAVPASQVTGTPMDSRRVQASGPRVMAMPQQVP